MAARKTVTVVFKKTYADWESLVSGGPYPAHIVKGKDMNQMFLNSIAVSLLANVPSSGLTTWPSRQKRPRSW